VAQRYFGPHFSAGSFFISCTAAATPDAPTHSSATLAVQLAQHVPDARRLVTAVEPHSGIMQQMVSDQWKQLLSSNPSGSSQPPQQCGRRRRRAADAFFDARPALLLVIERARRLC
jgi:hypothetical protein